MRLRVEKFGGWGLGDQTAKTCPPWYRLAPSSFSTAASDASCLWECRKTLSVSKRDVKAMHVANLEQIKHNVCGLRNMGL